ncbi:hypothetical protein [Rhodoferax sp. UBA5149]|uniref:hypothetical protein n=1 Tax=Rhodoferax sp. UBA5149 TaxID=1947379 RepID=UPI0025F0B428|nr:hypothetical protein [Rhodoferax sp. UBA5149]
MKPLIHKAATIAIVGALMMGSMFATATTELPPVHKSGKVEYLSGGIGFNESTAMQNVSTHWPLTLEFTVNDKPRAYFAANVKVVIRDAATNVTLQVKSDGPFLLVRVAPGKYTAEATLTGKTLHQTLIVGSGHPTKVVFVWPAGTGESRP